MVVFTALAYAQYNQPSVYQISQYAMDALLTTVVLVVVRSLQVIKSRFLVVIFEI